MTGVREAMKGHLKRYQKESDVSYAEGVFATLELLDAKPDAVERVLLSSYGEPNEGVAKIRTLCAERCIPLAVDDRTIERISPRASQDASPISMPVSTPGAKKSALNCQHPIPPSKAKQTS